MCLFLKSGASPPLSVARPGVPISADTVLRPAGGWVPHRTEAGDE